MPETVPATASFTLLSNIRLELFAVAQHLGDFFGLCPSLESSDAHSIKTGLAARL